jgi:two-component system OmpR family sensor kinase
MSIRLRLTLYWAAVLSAIVAIAALAAFKLFERQQWSALDAALLEEADTAAAEIAHGGAARASAVVWRLSEERDLGPRRRVLLVTASGVLADFGDRDAAAPELTVASGFRGTVSGPGAGFRFAVMPLAVGGTPALLEDGVDAAPLRDAVARLRNALLLTVPAVLILCIAGGYWLAGRALAPIASVASALAAIQPGDLSRRLLARNVHDEVGRLTGVINALLDRLERASAAERRFASDAAHELRTPLAVLRTGLEVALARERNAAESRAALESAQREVVALCKVAEELLMLARLGGDVAIDQKPVDLGALVGEVVGAVEPLAAAKGIALGINLAHGLAVAGHESHLKRLVINLLDNALKFTPAGGRIGVELARDGSFAVLRIADTGPGIDPTELPHIFERFFRGKRSAGDGAGLGLSLCSEIVRLHGGEIGAANRPAGGTELTVRIALVRSDSQRAA